MLYPGRERYPLAEGITALPLAHLPALKLEAPSLKAKATGQIG
ncbi:MAG: hypothetical protein ACREXX_22655 [Gammaproteobacteria bacterium]